MTIAITDVVIGLLLLYALVSIRFAVRSPVVYATLFLAGVIILSGVVNAQTDPTFDTGDFAFEYIRIVGLVAMVLLLPPLLRRVGHDRLAQGTLWVVRAQSVLLLADSLVSLPWSPTSWGFTRPTSVFGEPSFFAVYMALSLFYVLQVERNTGARYIRVFDIVLLGLAFVASDSVSSIIVLILFLLLLAMRGGVKYKAKLSIGVAVFALLLSLSVATFPDTGPGKNWDNTVGRVSNVLPHRFVDGSSRQRLIGSSLLAIEVLKEAPLLGTGLGGTNLNRLLERYEGGPQRTFTLSLTTIPVAVIAATGIMGLLAFAFILGWMLANPETRLIGLSLAAVALLWGGAFEQILWWHICLAVSLKGVYRRTAGEPFPSWSPSVTRSARMAVK